MPGMQESARLIGVSLMILLVALALAACGEEEDVDDNGVEERAGLVVTR